MDGNEYYTAFILKERLRELHAAARRDALLREIPPRPHPLSMALGTVLIRFGAWLMSERASTAPSEARK